MRNPLNKQSGTQSGLEGMSLGKGLVVLLTKNDAEGVRKALLTLTSQEGVKVGVDFDILVLDGGSTDGTPKVVEEFSHVEKGIFFKVQEVKGGVGPARIEAVKYAIDGGYEWIIWGDSGNEYTPNYIGSMVRKFRSGGCQVVSGRSIVKDLSKWSRMLYWYHLYHMLFPPLGKQHAPGNNKLVEVGVYREAMYPPTCRSDDFFFTLRAREAGIKFCYEKEAVLRVDMPSTLREVLAWESFRVKGLVEGFLMTSSGLPPIIPAWVTYAFSPALMAGGVYGLITNVPYIAAPSAIFLGLYALALTYVGLRLHKVKVSGYEKPLPCQALMGIVGMYIHAILTTYYFLKHYLSLRGKKHALKERLRNVLSRFGFDWKRYFPKA